MEEIKRIKKEKEEQLIRRLYDAGMPFTKDEILWIAEAASDIFESALIEVMTKIPRRRTNMNRIECYGQSSVDGRHPIGGKWFRITQIFTDKGTEYYTDGKEEVNVK